MLSVIVVETRLTEAMVAKLGPDCAECFRARKPTLGQKMGLKCNDAAHFPKHFGSLPRLTEFWRNLPCINRKRNKIVHRGERTVTSEEAASALRAANYAVTQLR